MKLFLTLLALVFCLCSAKMPHAQENPTPEAQEVPPRPLIADISNRQIQINSDFNGTRLLLFGARNANGDIVVVVRGPEQQFAVRKKKRIAGVWVNGRQITFEHVPAFYSIASSRPLEEIRNPVLFGPLNIGLGQLLPMPENPSLAKRHDEYARALLYHQTKRRLYTSELQPVRFMEETLFKTPLVFPDNIPGGTYTAEIYLFNDGQLVSMESTPIIVQRVGFDAFLYSVAHRYSAAYGLLAVLLALLSGWIAARVFEKI